MNHLRNTFPFLENSATHAHRPSKIQINQSQLS